jgi:trans-2,3-dihydro-3-hydroxyanthranilate isomerase
MRALPFFTVDVFTEVRFGGNPLAVVMADDTLGDATMQALAAEFNLSETTFVLPPEDAANTARVRIFNRKRGWLSPVIRWSEQPSFSPVNNRA